ncbi:wee1-like protein kinase [Halyomorpha halys]|uniref:wee1-like protein kinase n=1 Tax=Halyomorpha halys TaxID=286706 RepID=UPI0006D4FFC0|nr:wee1-like protein kinase [Halyomorpha halys]
MVEETKMETNPSDDEMDFIKRPAIMVHSPESLSGDESRPVTPPMDQSLKLNKSLGLIMSPQSPPYRKIRSLKLVETPIPFLKSRLDQVLTSTPNMSPCANESFRRGLRTSSLRLQRSRLLHFNQSDIKDKQFSPSIYVNPFTPNCSRSSCDFKSKNRSKRGPQKHITFDSDESMEHYSPLDDCESPIEIKKPRLSDFNIPRYQEEFIELEVIGTGVHGRVVKCLNRLNGVEYAVKRGLKPIMNERIAHNEIYAHGVLEHPNIVRNYSSWTENDYVYMQNEYCNGGSLEEAIERGPMDERNLRKVLEHVAQGLRFIHSKNLAHMDIKPGNILISKGPRVFYRYDGDEYGDDDDSNEETTYKIADLGHVTRLDEVVDVVEGDCRYLPKELLNDDYSNLPKVDIFALGLTLYEAAGGGPLPKNGEDWHKIREGKIITFPHLSSEFNNLIKRMIHVDPELRPTASELLLETSSSPIYKTVKDKHELKAAKQKIQLLEQRLQDVYKCVKVIRSHSQESKRQVPTTHNNNKGERLIGKKSKRSQSATNF